MRRGSKTPTGEYEGIRKTGTDVLSVFDQAKQEAFWTGATIQPQQKCLTRFVPDKNLVQVENSRDDKSRNDQMYRGKFSKCYGKVIVVYS